MHLTLLLLAKPPRVVIEYCPANPGQWLSMRPCSNPASYSCLLILFCSSCALVTVDSTCNHADLPGWYYWTLHPEGTESRQRLWSEATFVVVLCEAYVLLKLLSNEAYGTWKLLLSALNSAMVFHLPANAVDKMLSVVSKSALSPHGQKGSLWGSCRPSSSNPLGLSFLVMAGVWLWLPSRVDPQTQQLIMVLCSIHQICQIVYPEKFSGRK